jgi:phospholipid/cholesterol/gamma-HCH transport system substrate-binding protein
MTREIKIGILTFITILGMVWGYTFIKGSNMFSRSLEFYTIFSDVTGLEVSSPVSVNGYKIGLVKSIMINPENVNEMIVRFAVHGKISVPKSTKVLMKSEGVVGGKYLDLLMIEQCQANNCAQSGEFLPGFVVGLLGSMLDADEVSGYTTELGLTIKDLIANVGSEGQEGTIHETFRQIQTTTEYLAKATKQLNNLMLSSSEGLNTTIRNMNVITSNLVKNSKQVDNIFSNLEKTTEDLSKIDIGSTVSKADTALVSFNSVLESGEKAMLELTSLINTINNGDGSVAKLLQDEELYDNLNFASKNMALLLQDLRLNPKRYVNVSLIGRSGKEYTAPESDPAFVPQGSNENK